MIPTLESRVHEMKHREKMFRHSNVFDSVSCVNTSNDKDEKIDELKAELEAVRGELEKSKTETERKDVEMRDLNKKMQKMVKCFREQLTEKDAKIRDLNEVVVDLKGQIRVAVRVRKYDIEQGLSSGFTVLSQNEIKFEQVFL